MWRLLLYIPLLFIYSNLLFSPLVLGGDLHNVNRADMYLQTKHAYAWNPENNNGFGGSNSIWLPYNFSYFLFNKTTYFISDDELAKRIVFFAIIPISIILSAEYASKKTSRKWAMSIGFLLYYLNPYAMMLVTGGQVGVFQAYAWSPLVLMLGRTLYKNILSTNQYQKSLLIFILSLVLLLSMDFRVGILIMGICLITSLTGLRDISRNGLFKLIFAWCLIIISLLLTNAHVIASLLSGSAQEIITKYSSASSAEFFSFTRFAHSITWSHPNYPENLFGKVNEINPFAFIFPILAFATLKLRPTNIVIVSTFVALSSAFLAKGTNPPFDGLYLWLFTNFPGMSLFRDSTKFYIPLSLAYSYLIYRVVTELAQRTKNSKPLFFTGLIVSIIIISIVWLPTISKQLQGTFTYRTSNASFDEITEILNTDNTYGRVLWLPTMETHRYSSRLHPAVSFENFIYPPECFPVFCLEQKMYSQDYIYTREDLNADISQRLNLLLNPQSTNHLNDLGINYIALTPDIDKKIYLFEYKYDQSIYNQYKDQLESSIQWSKVYEINNLILFKLNSKGFLAKNTLTQKEIILNFVSPSRYSFYWDGGVGELEFAQSFAPGWVVTTNNGEILSSAQSTKIGTQFFEIDLPQGNYNLSYYPQKLVDYGWYLSLISIFIILVWTLYQVRIDSKQK